MIVVDTSIIVAWLDPQHDQHALCSAALERWLEAREELVVSNITYAELAAGGRTRESVDEDLLKFAKLLLDWESTWRAGQAFRRWGQATGHGRGKPVLPDFFIRAQAAVYGLPLLTNDGRRRTAFPEVDFLLV